VKTEVKTKAQDKEPRWCVSVPPWCYAGAGGEPCDIGAFTLYPQKGEAAIIMVGGEPCKEPSRIVAARVDESGDYADLVEGIKTLVGSFREPMRFVNELGAGVRCFVYTRPGQRKVQSAISAAFREAVGDTRKLGLYETQEGAVGVNIRTGTILDPCDIAAYQPASFDLESQAIIDRHVAGNRLAPTKETQTAFLNFIGGGGDPRHFTATEGGFGVAPMMPVVDLSKPRWRKAYGVVLAVQN